MTNSLNLCFNLNFFVRLMQKAKTTCMLSNCICVRCVTSATEDYAPGNSLNVISEMWNAATSADERVGREMPNMAIFCIRGKPNQNNTHFVWWPNMFVVCVWTNIVLSIALKVLQAAHISVYLIHKNIVLSWFSLGFGFVLHQLQVFQI